MSRVRLDQLLVQRGLVATRARARDAIQRGCVVVAGKVITKAGEAVEESAEIRVDDPAGSYVSRAALKLVAGLDHFGFDLSGLFCMDIGVSTGGFTQVMLERGAGHVFAFDVGHGQLHESLGADPRVTAREGLNARDLTLEDVGQAPQFLASDVSFISLTLALPPALEMAARGARAVFLVKPQFEAGREAIGKGGLVDPALGEEAATRVANWLDGRYGWRTRGLRPSPIQGGDGNIEYLLGAERE